MPPKKAKKLEKPNKVSSKSKKINEAELENTESQVGQGVDSQNNDSDNERIENESNGEENSDEKYDEIDEDDVLDGDGREIDDEDENENENENEEQEFDNLDDADGDADDDNCIYRFTKKKTEFFTDEDVDEDYFSDDEILIPEDEIFVTNDNRITKPVLTKYERVRLLADRTKQLSLGAKSMVIGTEKLNPKEIAKLELQLKVIPLIIIRPLPTGKKEKWRIHELEIVN